MQIIETKGNQELMNREKTLFLCSKKTPIRLYEYVFRWTDSLTERDCIACFDSTEMESEVLKALLVAKVPTILFVMNRFTDVNNIQIEKALQEERILIIVLKRNEPKGKGATSRIRNEYVLSVCQHVTCGYINKNGSVFPLLAGRMDVQHLMGENEYLMAADTNIKHERWTVAQDKMLLRMYYADMGIHAIHRRLQRTYTAIYERICSITQPEELLKGREFEDFVLGLFNIEEEDMLILQEWQGDKSLGLLQPENNSHPDFVFRYGRKEFAVECKWRQRLGKDFGKELFSAKRIENYKRFSEMRKIPVTIILGVGGEPCNPESLYVIPLRCIDSIVSGTLAIVEFLTPSFSLNIARFVYVKEKSEEKAYTMEEKRKQYPRAYKPWDITEDKQLLKMYNENKSIKELSTIFKRNEGAIRSRIKKLINEDAQPANQI